MADLVPKQGPAPDLDPIAEPVGLAHTRPGAVHEVSFPVYDLWFRPLDSFDGCPAHPAVFLVQPGDETFSITLSTVVDGMSGTLQLSASDLPIEHHIDGPQIRLRWPDVGGDPPRWILDHRPLPLSDLEMEATFVPADHTLKGVVHAHTSDGQRVSSEFTGVLRAREAQRLRERIAFPDPRGTWTLVGGTEQVVVKLRPSATPPVIPGCGVELRFAPASELLVGVRPDSTAGSSVVLLNRPAPALPELPKDPADGGVLRYLGQELCLAGRLVEARAVLDWAADLIEHTVASARPDSIDGGESMIISLVMLLNYQVRCALQMRDYPGLLRYLERAVALRRDLSDERHARHRMASIARTVGGQADLLHTALASAHASRGEASKAEHGLGEAIETLVGHLERAAAVLAAITAASRPQGTDLEAIVGEFESVFNGAAERLRDLADRCLDDVEGVPTPSPGARRERRTIVEMVERSTSLTPAELAELEQRDQALEAAVRTQMPRPAAWLFVLQKNAAVLLAGAANAIAESDTFLGKIDPLGNAARRKGSSSEGAILLTASVEQWRHRLDADADRILAVERAASFYRRLVLLQLDLGAPEQALLASELARARATADLVGALPADGLTSAELRQAISSLGRTVVEYFLGDGELVVWVVAPTGPVRWARRPVDIERLVATIGTLHRLMALRAPQPQDRSELGATLRWLGELLWDHPPLEALEPGRAVTVVPHRELGLVPFAGLVTATGQTLLERHPMTVLPAVALAPLLVDRGYLVQFSGPLLALVDPEPMPRPDLGPLTWTRSQFDAVARLFPAEARAVWTGHDASVERLRRPAHPPAVVMLATHAEATDDDVFVALAPTAKHDGRTTPAEVQDIDLPGSVVILSACHTGSGRATSDGVTGLSRAFLVGGASTLVMTLHQVLEDVALDLAYQFLQRWRDGEPLESAFRHAQLDLASQHRDDPALWIPFVLFGLGSRPVRGTP